MSQRDDETPTAPRTAKEFEEIAREVKRRSSQHIEIAETKALEIAATLGVDIDDPRIPLVVEKLRVTFANVLENAHRGLEAELADALATVDRMKAARKAELKRISDGR